MVEKFEVPGTMVLRPQAIMNMTDRNPVTYEIVVTRTAEDGTTESTRVEGYGLLREAMDDIEKMVDARGWLDDP